MTGSIAHNVSSDISTAERLNAEFGVVDSGSLDDIWQSISQNQAKVEKSMKEGIRISDQAEWYDTLIPLRYTCLSTQTASEDILRSNLREYLPLIAEKDRNPEYTSYVRYLNQKITRDQLYQEVRQVYIDSLQQYPQYAAAARNMIAVFDARLQGNHGPCTYKDSRILFLE